MLVPAILYEQEIEQNMKKYYYTNDMIFLMNSWLVNIQDEPNGELYQYAIVDSSKKLIGFLSYRVNWYNSSASQFTIISFDRKNSIVGRDLLVEMNKLLNECKLHRLEWVMVGENPVERHCDKFCKKHNGTKHILKDVIKDRNGNYHDSVVYEIVQKS